MKWIISNSLKKEKHKDNMKFWNLLQNSLVQFISIEKLYNNLQFLSQKTSSKVKLF